MELTAGLRAGERNSPLACTLEAIDETERPRYHDLVRRLRRAIQKREEVTGGFDFLLAGAAISLQQIAEWMSMERLCCPFLNFELAIRSGEADWHLTMTGPEGVKQLLSAEFPYDDPAKQA
jgi:hypothetical protein